MTDISVPSARLSPAAEARIRMGSERLATIPGMLEHLRSDAPDPTGSTRWIHRELLQKLERWQLLRLLLHRLFKLPTPYERWGTSKHEMQKLFVLGCRRRAQATLKALRLEAARPELRIGYVGGGMETISSIKRELHRGELTLEDIDTTDEELNRLIQSR